MKLLKEEQIEKILVANWTQFIDVSLLRAFVQQAVQKNINKLTIIPMKTSLKGNSISLSRFYYENNGYYFWVEFYNIIEKHAAEGTMEIFVPLENNQIKMISIIGSLHDV
jgi:hypothetical protein